MMETDIPEFRTKKAKIDHVDSARRQEKRIMSGASIVIENVLPFLKSVA
jgi:formylmethanofuran dehydrogenase subunit C